MKFMTTSLRQKIRRYKTEKDGATAIEFAVLALPFSALLFSIIELAVVFFIGSAVTHSMHETARDIRTGEFQGQSGCGSAAKFKAAVCKGMSGLGNCEANLRIDVVTSPTGDFQPGLLPPTPNKPQKDGSPTIPPDSYVDTPAQAVVVVRAQYYHPLSLPGTVTRLANQPGNHRVITATTAFRNEPFPNSCP